VSNVFVASLSKAGAKANLLAVMRQLGFKTSNYSWWSWRYEIGCCTNHPITSIALSGVHVASSISLFTV